MLSFCREQGPKSSPCLLMKCCWKTLVPMHCAQRPNYFWNVPWNSGNPDRDQGSSTASAQSVDWFVGDCSPYLEPAEVTWVSLLVFICWFIRLFFYNILFSVDLRDCKGKFWECRGLFLQYPPGGLQGVRVFRRPFTVLKSQRKSFWNKPTKNRTLIRGQSRSISCWFPYPPYQDLYRQERFPVEERKHEKEVEGTLFWSARATEKGGRETGTLSQLQWSLARNSQRLSAMPYPFIEEEGHKWKWKIKGKNSKKDRDYYLSFQFSLVFLAISWQNSQKQFTCILIFKIVISTAAKLGCALNGLVCFFPTFIKYQLQGQPFHLHGQHLRGETPEVNGSDW